MSARAELLRIAQRDGFLTPRSVLAEAEDPVSPLHSHFTWQDGKAAEQWRLYEASTLIRRYKVEVDVAEDKTVRVRAFSNVGEGRYRPTNEALRDPGDRDVVIAQAKREFRQLRRKYAALTDFDALVQSEMASEERKAS